MSFYIVIEYITVSRTELYVISVLTILYSNMSVRVVLCIRKTGVGLHTVIPVSYTHLDVYKRQVLVPLLFFSCPS